MLNHTFLKSTLAAASALVLTVAAQAQITVSKTNNLAGIFDASSGSRSFVFGAPDIALPGNPILDVNISINFAKADGEGVDILNGTPFLNETVFTLSRGATTVNLISAGSFNSGSSPFVGTILFDDAAANVVNVNPSVMSAGTFRPVGLLSAFNGDIFAPDTWTLFIQDTTGADALRFYEATLSVTYAGQITPVPEPSTYGLIGAALLGGVILRRRFASKKA